MTVSLVTGGCGFLGAAIAHGLQAQGDQGIVLDVAEGCPVEGVEYRSVDITDKNAVIEACRVAEMAWPRVRCGPTWCSAPAATAFYPQFSQRPKTAGFADRSGEAFGFRITPSSPTWSTPYYSPLMRW